MTQTKEIYGMIINRREPDPFKLITYPKDCDNYEWDGDDPRWEESFIAKGIRLKDYPDEHFKRVIWPDIYMKISSDVDNDIETYYFTNQPQDGFIKYEIEYSDEPYCFKYEEVYFQNIIFTLVMKRPRGSKPTDFVQWKYLSEEEYPDI